MLIISDISNLTMKAIKFKSKDWLTYLPTISYHQCDLVLQSGSTKLHLPLVLAAAASPRLANLLQDQQDKEQACVIISDYCQHTLAALSDLLTTGGTYSLNLRHMVELEEICTLLGFGRFPRRQRGAVKKIVDVAAPAQAAPKTLDAEVSSNNLNQVETVAKIAFPSTGPSPSSPISTSLQQKEVPFLHPVTLGTENHKEQEIAMEAEGNKEHMQKLRECILKEDEKKTYRDSRDPSVS